MTPNPGVKEEAFQCKNRLGNFRGIADMFHHENVVISHPECLFKGDDQCRYEIKWKAPKFSVLKSLPQLMALLTLLTALAPLTRVGKFVSRRLCGVFFCLHS